MKVLWFTNTSSLYDQGKHHYHGGGWIESLELLVKEQEGVELAVSFFHKSDKEKLVKKDVTYYPIYQQSKKKNALKKLADNWSGKIEIIDLQEKVGKVITDFQPDLIQVFGTEGAFSEIQDFTKIPVVYHIQGLINPYLNTYLAINQSKLSFHLSFGYLSNTIKGNNPAFDYKRFKNSAIREEKVLKKAKFVMGRTHWDKMLTELYNPNVKYFHVDEVLRPVFYKDETIFKQKPNKQFKIVSTLSPTIYKGIDVVLKTAKHLKNLTDIEFQWEIIGLDEDSKMLKHFEKSENIEHKSVDIICKGKKDAAEMVELMKTANVYVHPSYIDNSPNSICEAQLQGLPIIACDVGGVSTLIDHGKTGFLVPSNGVFEMVHYLFLINQDKTLSENMGTQAREKANIRHDKNKISNALMKVYGEIQKVNRIDNPS